MRAALLSLRLLSREWRSGELGVLLLALVTAVAALTGVAFLASRISAAVTMQASQVLAADIRLESPQPIQQATLAAARQAGLRTAGATGLLSVVFQGNRSQLADIDAVSAGYPLRGKIMVAEQPFAEGRRRESHRRGRCGRIRGCLPRSGGIRAPTSASAPPSSASAASSSPGRTRAARSAGSCRISS